MSKKRKDPEYEALKDVWYQKLKDDGFNDIETDEDRLKEWSTRFYLSANADLWQAKAAYYYMVQKFLNEHSFESTLDKVILEYHNEGIGCRPIAKLLNESGVIKTNHVAVSYIIKRLIHIMKQRYLPGYREEHE